MKYIGGLLLLAMLGCDKPVIARQAAPESRYTTETAQSARGLQWILDKYRNDNMHVLVAAHRGNWQRLPENSLSAISKCINNGVEILELDVRLTKDEQLILMHDKTLGRTATGSGQIKYLTLPYIRQQYLIDKDGKVTDERIPTLEEALMAAKGKALVMLDKSEYLLPWIEKVLERTGTAGQVIFLEFKDYKETVDMYGPLLDEAIYIPGVHQSNTDIEKYINDFEHSKLNPSCFAFWVKKETSVVLPYINHVQQTGDRIWMNTVDADQCAGHTDEASLANPGAGWGWAVDKGANILLTDHADKLIPYLLSINRRN